MKKATGIIRKVDELGRIVMPKELRKRLDIEIGTSIEIFTEGRSIILKKYDQIVCDSCGLKVDEEDKFCKHCGKELK